MKNPELENAEQMQKENPTTFFLPPVEEFQAIKEGWFVQICSHGERFWCIVLDIFEDKLTVTVDNTLINSEQHNLKYGDIIRIEKKHIYKISK